ncbi:HAD-IIB family hydrolase [Sulfurimonas marina]|uniref:HAD-IIB family hydrolase n=1 Tax=Sulfurimonas marina TaxID=2590551 RepID=A0A7M1AVF4_9BACT|nr:HAD-IIB family hydrolase [Sulfurimonas marina]QOP41419.1 HAD-IIB family hydrolase [Sulfurimonas marina]
MKKLIFTDLDGTLLNHDDYSFEPSLQALNKIKETQTPLIFTTSKTKAEVIQLQKKVGIIEPYITENGAALFIPKGYQGLALEELEEYEGYKIILFGKRYRDILNFYEKYKKEFGMKGFSEMSIDEIMELTQLDYEHAELAKQRDFTEPFVIEDPAKIKELQSLAQSYGLQVTQGGRFYHLIAKEQDKGVAVKETTRLFQKLFNEDVETFGFGDSYNDIPMFKNVDNPIIIQNHCGRYVTTDIENIEKSTYQGSAGFNEKVLSDVF